MSRFLIRLLVMTAASCLLLYAAAWVGRAVPATIIAARGRSVAPDRMDVLLIDLSRGISSLRHLAIPSVLRSDWATVPPQVLQRTSDRDAVVFTLNQLDFRRIQFEPLFTHRLSGEKQSRDLEIALAGSRAAVYAASTGEVALIDPGQPARTAATIEAGIPQPLVWSPDGKRLAIKAYRSAPLLLVDGEGVRTVRVFRDAAPIWSPDSRLVLLSQDSFTRRNGRMMVVDAATGEAHPQVADLPGRSAAWCDSDTFGYVHVTRHGSHTVRVIDLATGQRRSVLDAAAAEGQDISALTFAPRAACDWLLLEMRYPNERESRLYRLHIPTGDFMRLADNARLLELTPGGVTYESVTANVALTVESADFEIGAVPVVYGRVPAQNEAVLWLDGYRRGVFLRSGELWALDIAAGSADALPLPAPVMAFQVVADG